MSYFFILGNFRFEIWEKGHPFCVSYFSAAVIKHLDQKQFIGERFYLACDSRGPSLPWWASMQAKWQARWQEAERSHLNWKQEAESKLQVGGDFQEVLRAHLQWHTSFSEAAPPKPPGATAAGDQALKCLGPGDVSHLNRHPVVVQMPCHWFPYLMGS